MNKDKNNDAVKERLIADITNCPGCPEAVVSRIKTVAAELTTFRLLVAARKIDPSLTAGRMAIKYGAPKAACKDAVRLANSLNREPKP